MWLRCLHQSFWLFSKDAFDHLVSFRPQRYRQNPRGTKRRLRLSFSLNDVNQHNHKHTPRRKNQPDPLTQVSRLPKPSCRCSTQGRQRHNSAAPLSDPAYMRHTDEVSSNCAKIFCASSKLLRYCHISRVRTCASWPGRGAGRADPRLARLPPAGFARNGPSKAPHMVNGLERLRCYSETWARFSKASTIDSWL